MSRAPRVAESCVSVDWDLFVFRLDDEDLEMSPPCSKIDLDEEDLKLSRAWGESDRQSVQPSELQPYRTPLNPRSRAYVPRIESQSAPCVSASSWDRYCKPVLDTGGPYSLPLDSTFNGYNNRLPSRVNGNCFPQVVMEVDTSPPDILVCKSDAIVKSDAMDCTRFVDTGQTNSSHTCRGHERLPALGAPSSCGREQKDFVCGEQDHLEVRPLPPAHQIGDMFEQRENRSINTAMPELQKDDSNGKCKKIKNRALHLPRGETTVCANQEHQERKLLWNALALEVPTRSDFRTGRS